MVTKRAVVAKRDAIRLIRDGERGWKKGGAHPSSLEVQGRNVKFVSFFKFYFFKENKEKRR